MNAYLKHTAWSSLIVGALMSSASTAQTHHRPKPVSRGEVIEHRSVAPTYAVRPPVVGTTPDTDFGNRYFQNRYGSFGENFGRQ
jgi:hypothetical protein